jgi:hypothetical protein
MLIFAVFLTQFKKCVLILYCLINIYAISMVSMPRGILKIWQSYAKCFYFMNCKYFNYSALNIAKAISVRAWRHVCVCVELFGVSFFGDCKLCVGVWRVCVSESKKSFFCGAFLRRAMRRES